MATFTINFDERGEKDATNPNLERALRPPSGAPGKTSKVGVNPIMPPRRRRRPPITGEPPSDPDPIKGTKQKPGSKDGVKLPKGSKRYVGGPVPLKNNNSNAQKKAMKRRQQAIRNNMLKRQKNRNKD